jgi:hypothetical protein
MKISVEEHNLLLELAAEFDYPPFDEGKYVTAGMLAEKLGMTTRGARDRLDRMVMEGRLKKEYVRMPNGYRSWGYYKA